MTGPDLAERARRGGAALWTAVLVGIVAWMAHLTADASLVRLACRDPAWDLALHAITALTAVATAAGLVVCANLARATGEDEGAGTLAGRTRFVGLFGVLLNVASLALILLEGSYVLFIKPCA